MDKTNLAVVKLPATLAEDDASALVAALKAQSRSDAVQLDAAAVTSISPGYLQILVSAFKTFPQMTVVDASAAFAEAFAELGLSFPEGERVEIEDETTSELHHGVELEDELPPEPQGGGEDKDESASEPQHSTEAKEDAAPQPQRSNERASGVATAKTILAIDDSRTMRDMLKMTLGGAGFTVVEAVDGEDGLARLGQQPVDLIITDINMPKLDGYGVIRAVRSDAAYDDTPILVLSTEGEQTSKDIAKEAGATGWIVKPFDPAGLVKIVNTVCA